MYYIYIITKYHIFQCDDNLDELNDIYEYVTTTRIMYLQITTAYYTHNTNISQEENEMGLFEETDKFAKNMIHISKSMSTVCMFFHAAITLSKEHLFNPGAAISLKLLNNYNFLFTSLIHSI